MTVWRLLVCSTSVCLMPIFEMSVCRMSVINVCLGHDWVALLSFLWWDLLSSIPLCGFSVCWMAEFSLCVSRISALDECLLVNCLKNGKWFEPRSLSRLCGLIVRVRVVPRRTVVGDIDRRFDNLSGSHHQSHVNCVSSVYRIYVSCQFSRDVIGCFKSNRWLGRHVIGCWFVRSCCYWLWRLIGRR